MSLGPVYFLYFNRRNETRKGGEHIEILLAYFSKKYAQRNSQVKRNLRTTLDN